MLKRYLANGKTVRVYQLQPAFWRWEVRDDALGSIVRTSWAKSSQEALATGVDVGKALRADKPA